MTKNAYTYSIFGLILDLPFPCPLLPLAPEGAVPDVTVVEGAVPRNLAAPLTEDQNWQAAPGLFLLRGGQRAGRFLVERGERITLERNPAAEDSMLAAHFLASVVAALLRQRGLLVLHANVAVTPVGAIAITGKTGAGKSTTQAALLAHGCSMLADDIAVLCFGHNGTIVALPGIPKMNLCEDAAAKLGHDVAALPRNPLRSIKVVVPAHNTMTTVPVPLKAIYQVCSHAGEKVCITPLHGAEKFATLQQCIYGPLFAEEHPSLFSLCAAVTGHVNMFRIERPAVGWSVHQIVETILNG